MFLGLDWGFSLPCFLSSVAGKTGRDNHRVAGTVPGGGCGVGRGGLHSLVVAVGAGSLPLPVVRGSSLTGRVGLVAGGAASAQKRSYASVMPSGCPCSLRPEDRYAEQRPEPQQK